MVCFAPPLGARTHDGIIDGGVLVGGHHWHWAMPSTTHHGGRAVDDR